MRALRQFRLPTPPLWASDVAICSTGLLLGGVVLLLAESMRVSLLLFGILVLVLAWARERWQTRQRLVELTAQISVGKLEVADDPITAELHRAINTLLQQRRMEQEQAQASEPMMISTLAVSLPPHLLNTAEATAQLDQLATLVYNVAHKNQVSVQIQGSGMFVLVFGLEESLPLVQTSTRAVRIASELHAALPGLRFGLSYGMGLNYRSPLGDVIIAPAIDDAGRLVRMAHGWSEYTLLCPEPLALLLAPNSSPARTPLELTNPDAPALRVYALDLNPSQAVRAVGA